MAWRRIGDSSAFYIWGIEVKINFKEVADSLQLYSIVVELLLSHLNTQGPVWISDKTSYRKISWSLEAARSAV